MTDLKHILLAEDNPNDVELTLEGLSVGNLANRVTVVSDGEAALDYLYRRGRFAGRAGNDPAVVLLDLKMPKVDAGGPACRQRGSVPPPHPDRHAHIVS